MKWAGTAVLDGPTTDVESCLVFLGQRECVQTGGRQSKETALIADSEYAISDDLMDWAQHSRLDSEWRVRKARNTALRVETSKSFLLRTPSDTATSCEAHTSRKPSLAEGTDTGMPVAGAETE